MINMGLEYVYLLAGWATNRFIYNLQIPYNTLAAPYIFFPRVGRWIVFQYIVLYEIWFSILFLSLYQCQIIPGDLVGIEVSAWLKVTIMYIFSFFCLWYEYMLSKWCWWFESVKQKFCWSGNRNLVNDIKT